MTATTRQRSLTSLGRVLARELTPSELSGVAGAGNTSTVYCTLPGQIGEDCELVTDCD